MASPMIHASVLLYISSEMEINANIFVLLATIIFPFTLIITYSISLYNKHIVPVWPYISNTGDDPVESCFFSLGLNIVAGLYSTIVFFRYAQIESYIQFNPNNFDRIINKSAIIWGFTASFFLSMTSSYQQRYISILHVVAALICSYTALGYFWHQTYFSRKFYYWITWRMKIFRHVLSILSTIIHCLGPIVYFYSVINHPMPAHKVTEWEDTETMVLYLTGSSMEWAVFTLNVMYIMSFYWEFQNIKLIKGSLVIILQDPN